MNTQLQRMMVVLFLLLTLITVAVLFLLPVNNDSTSVLVARETIDEFPGLSSVHSSVSSEDPPAAEEEAPEPALQDNLQDALASNLPSQNETEAEPPNQESTPEITQVAEQGKQATGQGLASATPPALQQQSQNSAEAPANFTYDVTGNKRKHLENHQVQKGEWFSTITGKYWPDLFLWPDLYTMNSDNLRSRDPDLIYPDEHIRIYESLVADGTFSPQDKITLLDAYLEVYKTYKQGGEAKDLAAARLLAAALRYDKEFLNKHADVIAPKDRTLAEQLVKEQKFLD